MKTIKILMITMVFLSTTISVAQQTWSNNRYTFNNDQSNKKLYLNINDNTPNAVEFRVGNSIDYMSFEAPSFGFKGNLGVGTTNPSEKLQVAGNVRATQFIGDGSGLTNVVHSGDFGNTDITTDGHVYIGGALPAIPSNYGVYVGNHNDVHTPVLDLVGNVDALIDFTGTSSDFKGRIRYNYFDDAFYVHTKGMSSPALIIDDTQKTTIGTTYGDPNAKLDVKGFATISNSASNYLKLGHGGSNSLIEFNGAGNLDFRNSGTTKMRLSASGNLGLGTSSPSEKLDVNGNIKASGTLDFSTTSRQKINLWDNAFGIGIQTATQYFRTNNHFAWYKGGVHSNTVFDPGSGGTAHMVLKNGSLGVGTTNPSEKLEVAGNVKAAGINLEGDGANTNTIDSNINGTIVFGGEDGSTLTNAQIANSFYPDFAVWVEEGIVAEDIAVAPSSEWDGSQPDYVFENDYELPSLEDVEAYVTSYKHLEGIPSKAEVAEKGWSLPNMDQKLLKKVEELTLYTIQQEKEIKALKALVDNLVETIKN
jgi:hypothetical protein